MPVFSAARRCDWFEVGVEPLTSGLVGGFVPVVRSFERDPFRLAAGSACPAALPACRARVVEALQLHKTGMLQARSFMLILALPRAGLMARPCHWPVRRRHARPGPARWIWSGCSSVPARSAGCPAHPKGKGVMAVAMGLDDVVGGKFSHHGADDGSAGWVVRRQYGVHDRHCDCGQEFSTKLLGDRRRRRSR